MFALLFICALLTGGIQAACIEQILTQGTRNALQTNQFDEARALATIAVRLDPDDPAHYTLRGQVSLALYEWDQALEDYNTALDRNATYAPAYFHRGVLYYSILQTGLTTREAALSDFETYLRIAPQGAYAQSATRYADSIRRELETLEDAGT